MSVIHSKASLIRSGLAAAVLLVTGGAAFAQTVSLTAAPTQTTLPDGQSVPMWGYSCSTTTLPTGGATCAAANANAGAGNWSPVVITVPYTESGGVSTTNLTIGLTNSLSFAGAGTPTSLVIVGQLGGGLGVSDTNRVAGFTVSPTHAPQGPTWPASGGPDPSISTCSGAADQVAAAAAGTNCPPAQPNRVQSFATEVAAGATTPLLWSNLQPGTYLIESGTHPSIQGPMGLYGVLIVTQAPTTSPVAAGVAYSRAGVPVNYDSELPLVLSEIDPVQNAAVDAAVRTAGFSETKVWNGQPGQCGDLPPSPTAVLGSAYTCYPPAVNYDPRYFLINGVSFDQSASWKSQFGTTPTGAAGSILVRFVNAGLRMHVPSIVSAITGGATPVPGVSLIAEDGNLLPGVPKVQSEVFLAAGKTTDVLINDLAPKTTLAVFDRHLSLTTNTRRGGGMMANIARTAGAFVAPVPGTAANETYYCVAGTTLAVTDPSKGVLANDPGANGAKLGAVSLASGSLTFNSDGTFTYLQAPADTSCGGSFTYLVNGLNTGTATITRCDAGTGGNGGNGCSLAGAPVAGPIEFTSNIATRYAASPPGILAGVTSNPGGLALTAVGAGLNADGSFVATPSSGTAATCPIKTPALPAATVCRDLSYQARNSQGAVSGTGHGTIIFLPASNLNVVVRDAKTALPVGANADTGQINDYRWIIEEDRTFYVDPKCQVNSTDVSLRPASCPPLPVQSLGYNFHTSYMPIIAAGCVGTVSCEAGQSFGGGTTAVACDLGNGACRAAAQKTPLNPSAVYLDPAKRYYISILPGDGVNPTLAGSGGPVEDASKPSGFRPFSIATECGTYSASNPHWVAGGPSGGYPDGTFGCGHAMSGQQISGALVAAGQTTIRVPLEETPLTTAKITALVFADDNPLNGEQDAGGPSVGVTGLGGNEPGLGGFNLELFDQAGGFGDSTGQITYDMFNQPVSNALAGTIDPFTGQDACPITAKTTGNGEPSMVGMIPTCPHFEADGVTESPLEGQAVIANLYPGLYEVVARPAADRIARGEEWLQTNTLDGTPAHEAFIKAEEPSYFQEFGPGGFHVAIGFANGAIINARKNKPDGRGLCDPPNIQGGVNVGGGGLDCSHSVFGRVTSARMSRTPDQRIYSSGDYSAYGFTQCYVSMSQPDAADFAFAKCDPDGNFQFDGVPTGDYKLTVFDQYNDLLVDGLVSPIHVGTSGAGASDTNRIVFPVTQWRTNMYTRTFLDQNGDGVSQAAEPGLPLVATNIRYRDGSFGFFNNTDLDGYAGFNEVFPFLNWLVVETDTTRFKSSGTHVIYDAGGPADAFGGAAANGVTDGLANSIEHNSLPAPLQMPGARYCANALCPAGDTAGGSTGRVDPPGNTSEGWQGLLGQNSFIEYAMKPFAPGENGGIKGHVIYASTRPFDDPQLLLQLSWEPGVPRVTINLYQELTGADGVTSTLQLVDTTTSSSWDDWAQGFRSTTTVGGVTTGIPNMNCPGQDPTSPFFQTLQGSTQWLNPTVQLPNNAQFKCFDGWAMLNQVQPAPYDGMYKFPSVTATDPTTGKQLATGTNCHMRTNAEPWGCVPNPDATDTFRSGTPMLPAGKYVVEIIVPPGMELVKEEDKNILLGDIYVAPVTSQFAGFGNIFIMPDQAAVGAAYNGNSPGGLNLTTNLGAAPRHEGDTGSIETFWPCVGQKRQIPDWNSLYPTAGQNSPFAGAMRNLCDRKEVTLEDQHSALAKFYIFSSTHVAGHFTGTMTNDFASEFDPFSPQFGEKFSPPNLPVGVRDFAGKEIARVYADQWGIFNGLNFSTYGVNPPNPTGYVPQIMIACMNDPGPIARTDPVTGRYVDATGNPVATADLAQQITDPAYSPAYSNFCYETPFMPGQTQYMDTPVIPTQAFADGYNLPDSEYPDLTPAISTVTGTASGGGAGPWVSAAGQTLTIRCLGYDNTADPCTKVVPNPAYSGPGATTAPFNQKTITRHYGFGSPGSVTIGGVTANCSQWTNSQLTCTVPAIPATLNTTTGVGSTCYNGTSNTIPAGQTPPQRGANGQVPTTGTAATQRADYRCGQLVITTGSGKRSIDAITVTVAGKAPSYVNGENPAGNALQAAIDAAAPGDLIIVGPGTYRENLLMWKPVRLQGVGAGAVTINADAHPAGKLDAWRRQVVCLFGLALNGVPRGTNNPLFDPTGTYSCPNSQYLRVDRIPFEAIVGWDATGNGNLAQLLQEPTLMGAYEGAGITVLGRGVRIPANSNDFWGLLNPNSVPGDATAGEFPDGSTYLTNSSTNCAYSTTQTDGRDYGTGNFLCNPSRIDGLSVINSSQGGGGIFIHGWNHFLEVANTRVYGNHGTLSGGINVGSGETPLLYVNDGTLCGPGVAAPAPLCPPLAGTLPNAAIPYQMNTRVHVHNNAVYNNASLGDALFSGAPSGAGGVTISAGSDRYRFDHNWIAGNLSSGDGGGVVHSGLSFNGTIDHNYIVFNQSSNPTLPTHGGGLGIIGANGTRTLPNGDECNGAEIADCPPGLGDGAGANLMIDSNLIIGNSAESGSGGGLRLQQVNGTEVVTTPYNLIPTTWYGVTVQNNIIANNVAGWDGAGVSMEDALRVTLVNNTIVSNDTSASAGVLFKTLGAVDASSPPPGCNPTTDLTTNPQDPNCLGHNAAHIPQPAGLVTMRNTPNLVEAMNGLPTLFGIRWICPSNQGYSGGLGTVNANCGVLSLPRAFNDMFWQNRAFHVEITGAGTGLQSQQNLVSLLPMLNQAVTGDCANGASYWDVGVRNDTGPTNHNGGATLALSNSILTSLSGGYTGNGNRAPSFSPVNAQFCNGSRVPPENGGHGYLSPPGRSETTGLTPLFVFNNITPAATVDEGNNWINLSYGPLSLFNNAAQAMLAAGSNPATVVTGAYSIGAASNAVNGGSNSGAPGTDFFGNSRALTAANPADIGAVEFQPGNATEPVVSVSPSPLAFGQVATGTTATRDLTVVNNGGAAMTTLTITPPSGAFARSTAGTFPAGAPNCGTSLAAGSACTIRVVYTAAAVGTTSTGTVGITGSATVAGAPVALSGTSVAIVRSMTAGPNPLDFGPWAVTKASPPQAVTLLNTGNVQLTGLTFTTSGAAFSPASGNGGGTCTTTLNPGDSCTINRVFTASSAIAFNGTLTIAGAGGVTSQVVQLHGTGVAAAPSVSLTPNPLTITLPSGSSSGSGTVTVKNTAAAGGAQVAVTGVTIAGGSLLTFFFSPGSSDGCTGHILTPQETCTVSVNFTNVLSPRGMTRNGTITVATSGTATASQVGQLRGFATP